MYPVLSLLSAAAIGLALSTAEAGLAPAQAAPVDLMIAQVQSGEVSTGYAQYRGRGYHSGPRYYGRSYGGRSYRRNGGGVAAGVIGGLAAGAIIGGAIASQQAQAEPLPVAPEGDADAYCAQRFRSYDPASGTYLGYDGVRRPCP